MQNKNHTLMKLSILLVSVITASAPAINANIPVLAKAFPNVPLAQIELLTTIPSFFLMIAVLLSSWIAKRIGLKQTVIVGVIMTAVAGLSPIFINSFSLLMVSRALFGFGVGLFNSLLVTIISYFFKGPERSQTLGFQSTFEGLGGVLVTFIAGQLVQINWHMSFWAYAITIPALILFTLFVPSIPKADVTTTKETKVASKAKLPKALFGYLVMTFVVITFHMIMGIKVPTLMVSAGYGTATSASFVILSLSLGAMLGGILFGRVFLLMKDYILVIAFVFLALAMSLIAVSNTTWLTMLGGFFTGIGARFFFPWVLNAVNIGGTGNALATSIVLVVYNLAGSLSPYTSLLIQDWLNITNLRDLFWLNAAVYAGLTLILAIVIRIKQKKPTMA
ncbi:MFS transporter [Secundilactobacillus malefermentans]|uniref:MFS transporter n=1 Tax=Secundilactobacillus malefermentans TaxID=176292 RepID=UPI0011CBF3F1|nr:MFS transporter [Secundilactobacillus malefermentans]QEA31419.1 MFS transporter [Secundilactobacillus malefermentans]